MPLSAQLVLDVLFGILFVCLHLYRTRKRGHTLHRLDWSEWLDAFGRGSAMYFIFAVSVLVVSSFRPFIKGVYIRLPWWSWSILCLVCVLAAVKLFQLTKAWLSVGIMTRPAGLSDAGASMSISVYPIPVLADSSLQRLAGFG
jgi:hypothetical protein